MSDPQFTAHVVRDAKRRRLRFDGAVLAEVSSRRPHAARWAVLSLYGLPPGDVRYVFSRIGHSRVYHVDECPEVRHRLPYGHEATDLSGLDELVPCRTCGPSLPRPGDPSGGPDFLTTHRFEVTKYFAAVLADADALVDMLSDNSAAGDPARRSPVPWLSAELLNAAAVHDAEIAAACSMDLSQAGLTVLSANR